jgi:outer membrane lipoprotein SlyB
MNRRVRMLAVLGCAALAGCVTSPNERIFDAGSGQAQLRSVQSRTFATADTERALRATIATLQDLGFVIDKADAVLGTVSGTKLAGYEVRMTVSVLPRSPGQVLVRANAQFNGIKAIEDPKPYQDFFAALEKSLFLADPPAP